MGREIDSGALVLLNKGLGIRGTASGVTVLDEDNLSQVVDVSGFARQALPPGSGLFYFLLRIITSVANPNLTIDLDIYDPIDATAGDCNQAPFPLHVDKSFDIYLIRASMVLDNATFNDATLNLVTPIRTTGWAIQNNDSVRESIPPAGQSHPLGFWNAVGATGGLEFALTAAGDVNVQLGFRVVRGGNLGLRVDAGGINTASCLVLAALMPRAMGQDVAI